jgi:hypothetical protein
MNDLSPMEQSAAVTNRIVEERDDAEAIIGRARKKCDELKAAYQAWGVGGHADVISGTALLVIEQIRHVLDGAA